MAETIALLNNSIFYELGIKESITNYQLQNITSKELEQNSLLELLGSSEIAIVTSDFVSTEATIPLIESLLGVGVKVIYLVSEVTSSLIPHLCGIGCQGIVTQPESQLMVAISAIRTGGRYYSQGTLDSYMQKLSSLTELFQELDSVLDKLTPRESEIFELYVVGESLVNIMKQLNIAKTTLNTHMESIRNKFGVETNREIVAKYQISQLRTKKS